ncbi:hypothetical protein GLP59_01860 [Sulfitobacter sp. M220]|nr:hypothetical protein [Sulfitobacter sp. M220]
MKNTQTETAKTIAERGYFYASKYLILLMLRYIPDQLAANLRQNMEKFEVVTADVDHQGMLRTVKMIRDASTLVPYFPASIWLLHQYHHKPRGYDQLAHRVANFLNFARLHGVEPLEVDRYF